jgi:hypothetical protein
MKRYGIFVLVMALLPLVMTGCPNTEPDDSGSDVFDGTAAWEHWIKTEFDAEGEDSWMVNEPDFQDWASGNWPLTEESLELTPLSNGVIRAKVKDRTPIQWAVEFSRKFNKNYQPDTWYRYDFEAWTESGSRNIEVRYYRDPIADGDGYHPEKSDMVYLTTERKAFTVTGKTGKLAADFPQAITFKCGDQTGIFYVRLISATALPDDWSSLGDGWWRWIKTDYDPAGEDGWIVGATGDWLSGGWPLTEDSLGFTLHSDGVAQATVKTWAPLSWVLQFGKDYPAQENTEYIYTFEAWTTSAGNPNIWVRYYYMDPNPDPDSPSEKGENLQISTERKQYSITGTTGKIAAGASQSLTFFCGGALGRWDTLFVKIISITPKL